MAILIVEDEMDLSDLLSYCLRRAGHDVIVAFDGDSALALWRQRSPELVLLDVGLPKTSGWDVCRIIRSESSTPVMIVSGADAEDDMVRGFDLGVEDYVVKPFSPRLLQARIRTILRRAQAPSAGAPDESSMTIGDLEMDARWRTISNDGKSAALTKLEFRLLQELARHHGQVVPHGELVQKVWGYKGEDSSSLLKGHIRSVRLKLREVDSQVSIRIVAGVGYIMEQVELAVSAS